MCYLPGCGGLALLVLSCCLLALEPERVSSEPNQFGSLLGPYVQSAGRSGPQPRWRKTAEMMENPSAEMAEGRELQSLVALSTTTNTTGFHQLRLNFSCCCKEESRFVWEFPQSSQDKHASSMFLPARPRVPVGGVFFPLSINVLVTCPAEQTWLKGCSTCDALGDSGETTAQRLGCPSCDTGKSWFTRKFPNRMKKPEWSHACVCATGWWGFPWQEPLTQKWNLHFLHECSALNCREKQPSGWPNWGCGSRQQRPCVCLSYTPSTHFLTHLFTTTYEWWR